MKGLLVFAAAVAAASAWGQWDEGLSVRFDIGLFPGRSFFIELPQTVSEAKNQRWVESPRPEGAPLPSLTLYTPSINDVVVGTLYDAAGDVAGLQIALPQDSYTDAALDWATQGFVQWTAPANSSGGVRTYWVTAQYFVSEATLALSAEQRAGSRKGRILQEDNIYVTGYHGELVPIPVTASGVANTAFTRQACLPLMGRHYFYDTTPETECSAETLFPWFALVDGSIGTDQLIASGVVTFGNLPASSLVRDYFERPNELAVRTITPNGPDCLYKMARDIGLVTMHIYYVDSPMLISCIGM